MVGWPKILVGSGIGMGWEVDSQKWWGMGGWPRKQVLVGRLTPKTGGKWEVETPAYRL